MKTFLNGLLRLEGEDRIESLTFKSDEKIALRAPFKESVIFDIFATTESGRFFDIEMQRANHADFLDRVLWYHANLTVQGKQAFDQSIQNRPMEESERKRFRYALPETVSV